MLTFPSFLFKPTSIRARLVGAGASGGRSMANVEQISEASGGGLWSITLGEMDLWERTELMPWRAMEAALDNGGAPIIVPIGDRLHAPLISPAPAVLAFPDDAIWDDTALSFTPVEVDATLSADAALRATTIDFDCAAPPVPLIGGEYFAVLHPVQGWRLYLIIRLTDNGGGNYTAQVRPPLREAMTSGDALNFEAPRLICHLDGDPDTVLELLKFGKGGPISFRETFPNLSA